MRTWTHLAASAIAILVAVALFVEWRSERRDRARLQVALSQAEQSLQHATESQEQRDKQLTDAVAKLESLKATVKTQQQIVAQLPDLLPLPKPIGPSKASEAAPAQTGPSVPDAPRPAPIALPSEDLKPLYDFAVDCKACRAKLAAATADLADEKTKTQALSRERDAALKLARGGSLRQRMGRAAKWFVVGAIAGIVAAKAH